MSMADCVDGLAGGVYPCGNVDLLAFLPLDQIGGGNGNDVWGWTDPEAGKEYTIVGRTTGTSFVDITDPANPIYLGNLPPHASSSTWRDIKVYRNYAFVVSEAIQSGMQVFDLTQLRNVASPPAAFSETAWYSGFSTAHNIAINEETGFAYAVGTNTCSGGLHMVNISDPEQPAFAGCFSSDGYTHDTQCVIYHGPDTTHQGNEVCFSSNEDTLTIVDVTNKSAPVLLSRTGYAGARYTHQGWLTEDHAHFLVDDELDEYYLDHTTRTYIWDLSDLDGPALIGFYASSTTAIDHNQYVKGDYVYQANYRAGLRILDIRGIASANLTEVAYFDIYPSDDAPHFNGAWSTFPYFASGNVVVSGIEQGLFILRPTIDATSAPPQVSILSPTAGEVWDSVPVTIDALDSEDAPASLTVEWNIDGGPWLPATLDTNTGKFEAIWDTTTGSNGTKTLNARAVDSDSLAGFDSRSVIVSNLLPALHVSSIAVTVAPVSGPRNRGVATVAIADEGGAPVSGVSVSGSFTGDWSGTVSASTDSAGQATLETPPVKNGSNWTFCVESLAKDGWAYDDAANGEDCGGTNTPSTVGSVAGQVTDSSTGLPVSGASVSTDTGQSGQTDSVGSYQLSGVPTGSRTVAASAGGYATTTKTALVIEGSTVVVDFDLTPETSSGSGTIKGTVTASNGTKMRDVLVETDTGHSAVTNNGGQYTIQNVPSGNRTVTASKQGYISDAQAVQLSSGQNLTVSFTLAAE